MAISFVRNLGGGGSGTSYTQSFGSASNFQAGDLLVAALVGRNAMPNSIGWNPVDICASSGVNLRVEYKIATGNASQEPNVTVTVPIGPIRIVVIVFRGTDKTNPIHAYSNGASYGAEYSSVNGLSTEFNDSWVANVVGFFDVNTSDSTNYNNWINNSLTDLIERADNLAATSGGAGVACLTGVKALPGYVSATTATADSNVNYSATVTIAITPEGTALIKSASASNSIGIENSISIEKNSYLTAHSSVGLQALFTYEIIDGEPEIIEKDIVSDIGFQSELFVSKAFSTNISNSVGIQDYLKVSKISEESIEISIGIQNSISVSSQELDIRTIDLKSDIGLKDSISIFKSTSIIAVSSIGMQNFISIWVEESEVRTVDLISTIGLENHLAFKKIVEEILQLNTGAEYSISIAKVNISEDYLELIGSILTDINWQGSTRGEELWLGSLTSISSKD